MKYLIPSFKRSEAIFTPSTLVGYGVGNADIAIGVQTEEDFKAYAKHGFQLVYTDASNASGNRNGLIRWARDNGESEFVLMDDDITSFMRFVEIGGGKLKTEKLDAKSFGEMVSLGFSSIGDEGVFGIRATTNVLFAKNSLKKGVASRNVLLCGYLMGVRGSKFIFDESVRFSEDYEACLNMIASGFDSVRLEQYCCSTKKPNGEQAGGCHELYRKGARQIHRMQKEDVVDKYPGLVTFTSKSDTCNKLKMAVRL